MAIVAGDFVQVLHEGSNDITDYVVSYRRYSSLCEMGDTFEIVFSPDLDVTLSPYDDIRITEWYDGDSGVILRGYVLIINQSYDGAWVVQGQDRSVLLFDYFIPTQIKSQGESVDFWIQYYADQVGLEITFQASSENAVVAPDTLMGMQTAGEGILTMERLAAYYVRFDSSSNKLVAYRLGSSQPVITIDDVVEGRRLKGTEKTRNVVRVYGGYRYSLDVGEPPEMLTSVARTDIPELLVDKTVVVASPGLQKQTYLDIVADRILNTVNSIDDVHFYSLPAFVPNIEVGEIAYLNVIHPPHISYAGERKISSIEASFDQSGAVTIIGVGEKCPRISIQFPTPPVYATTTEDGVAVSWNAGNSFVPSNTGLTGSGLMGENIGVNSYGQQMVLTAAGIFRRPSTAYSWTFVDDPSTLPAPVNDSNDQPSGVAATDLELIRIVDEPTNRSVFHFMANGTASGLDRSWVYTTKDFGDSWSSTQLYIPAASGFQEHGDAPTGLEYDVYGHDLFSAIDNNVFALITSTGEVEQVFAPSFANAFYNVSVTSAGGSTFTFRVFDRDGAFETKSFPGGLGSSRGLVSVPRDRTIVYVLKGNNLYRSKNSGDDWTNLGTFNSALFTITEGLYIDWGSLSDGETVKIIGMGEGRYPISGDAHGYTKFTIATDNINTDVIESVAEDRIQFPDMVRDYEDDEDNEFTVGQQMRWEVSSDENWYAGTSGGQSAKAGTRSIGVAPATGGATKRPVLTTNPSGGNFLYMPGIAIVAPKSPFKEWYSPPYMNIFVVRIDIDAGTGSLWSNTRFNDFTLDTGVFEGPDIISQYPDDPGDGLDYAVGVNSVISTAVAIGLQIGDTPIGFNYTNFANFYPMTASAGGVSNPTSITDFSAAAGKAEYTLEAQHAEQSLTEGQGKRTGVVSARSDPDDHIDGAFASDAFVNGNGTEGQVIQMTTSATISKNKYYHVIRTDWDSGQAANQQGEYNVYEGTGTSTSPTALFAGHIDSVVEKESTEHLSHYAFWDIAEEVEE